MRETTDILLYSVWRLSGALGIAVVSILCALPVVLFVSLIWDSPPPAQKICAAAVETWSGHLVAYRTDFAGWLVVTVRGPAGDEDIHLASVESPLGDHRARKAALEWLCHKAGSGQLVTVYALHRRMFDVPRTAHLVVNNLWLNGTLIEQGLARVAHRSEVAAFNTALGDLLQLQDEAQFNGRGIWGKQR